MSVTSRIIANERWTQSSENEMIGVKPAKFGNATIQCYCIDADQIAAPEVASHVQTRRYFKCAAQNICGEGCPVKWKKHTCKRTGVSIYFVCGAHLGDVTQMPSNRKLTDHYLNLLLDPSTGKVINAPPAMLQSRLREILQLRGEYQEGLFPDFVEFQNLRRRTIPGKADTIDSFRSQYAPLCVATAEDLCNIGQDVPFLLQPLLPSSNSERKVLLTVTSKALLAKFAEYQAASPCTVVHLDATFKLSSNHHPVLTCCFSDANGVAHPLLLAVASATTAEMWKNLLERFVWAMQFTTSVSVNVTHFMFDHDSSIAGAVGEMFPTATPLSCWFHLKMNVEKELTKKKYDKSQKEIRSWLLSMHCASSAQEYEEIYNRAVAAVPRRNALHEFVDSYFEKSYFTAPFNNWQVNYI